MKKILRGMRRPRKDYLVGKGEHLNVEMKVMTSCIDFDQELNEQVLVVS